MLSNKQIKILLGEPVINVEITDEQIDEVRIVTENQLNSFNGHSKNFLNDKLFLINCRKMWANNIMKYSGNLPDGMSLQGKEIYETALTEERNLFDVLNLLDK